MLSSTSEHALRAISWIARVPGNVPVVAADVAAGADVPRGYLSKILGQLARTGVLEARRGLRGGYRLARTPKSIRLLEIIAPFEPLDREGACVFGNGRRCNERQSCSLHKNWSRIREALDRFLAKTTLADVLKSGARL
ncbi:MAG: Rrf2 family transcriptional regulator [Planctomycetes bacterium]|nr:Rrf2 family transcriptional regulator [Planctomycetota bacterium]